MGPDLDPGCSGFVQINREEIGKTDMVRVTVNDKSGNAIHSRTFPVKQASIYAQKLVQPSTNELVEAVETEQAYILKSSGVEVRFSKIEGTILSVKRDGRNLSFINGPVATVETDLKEIVFNKEKHTVSMTFSKGLKNLVWEMIPGGLLNLEYNFNVNGEFPFIGMNWDYPEEKVKSVRWMGNGPYRVWKNRMRGAKMGVWEKEYNSNIPGETWIYPEFKGYHSNLYWAEIQTTEGSFKIISETDGVFLRLFTPNLSDYAILKNTAFPAGDISLMHAISPIGTKFTTPENTGPQGQLNVLDSWWPYQKRLTGKFWFDFR
jgi:hypothetical protein